MKKKLFGLSLTAVILCNLISISSSILIHKQSAISGIPPIVIRPPVKKFQFENYNSSFINKSTFVDLYFEV